MGVECQRSVKYQRGWHVPVLVLWVIAALGVPFQFVLQSTPNVMIIDLMRALHIDEVQVGFLTSSFFYTYLLFQVPAGIIVDRYGARLVLSSSVLLGALASLMFALANSFAVAEISRLLMGLVTAPCVPAVMYVAAKNFTATRFVILAGLAESIGMVGGAIGGPVLGELVIHLGWRQMMFTCAVVGVCIAALMFLFIRDKHAQADDELRTCQFKKIIVGFNEAIKNSQVWLIALFGALIFAMLPALAGLWVVQSVQDLYQVQLEIATFGSFAMFLGTAFGLPFWGWLSGRVRMHRRVMFSATGLNFLVTVSFVFMHSQSLGLAFVQLFLMGFTAGVYVLAFAMIRERTKEVIRASAMGLTNMMTMVVGGLFLQPLIGNILRRYSVTGHHALQDRIKICCAYEHALSTVIICLVLAFIAIFFIKETYCVSQVEE